jgi:hypothetical protein
LVRRLACQLQTPAVRRLSEADMSSVVMALEDRAAMSLQPGDPTFHSVEGRQIKGANRLTDRSRYI